MPSYITFDQPELKLGGKVRALPWSFILMVIALGVIGDLLAAQRVMTQKTFERVRRIELELGIPPSHYERGEHASVQQTGSSGAVVARGRAAPRPGEPRPSEPRPGEAVRL